MAMGLRCLKIDTDAKEKFIDNYGGEETVMTHRIQLDFIEVYKPCSKAQRCNVARAIKTLLRLSNPKRLLFSFVVAAALILSYSYSVVADECDMDRILKRYSNELAQIDTSESSINFVLNNIMPAYAASQNAENIIYELLNWYGETQRLGEIREDAFLKKLHDQMEKLGNALAIANIAWMGWQALQGDDTAKIQTAAEIIKLYIGWGISELGSRTLSIAVVGVFFIDYALNNFIQEAFSLNKDYWWNIYVNYMENKYPHIVKGQDSWVNLIIKEGEEGVQRRLEEFWVDPWVWQGVYGQGKTLSISKPASVEKYKKEFAAEYYRRYLHPTIKTFFRKQAERAYRETLARAENECHKIKRLIAELKKRYRICGGKLFVETPINYLYKGLENPRRLVLWTNNCNYLNPNKGGLESIVSILRFLKHDMKRKINLEDFGFRLNLLDYYNNLPDGGFKVLHKKAWEVVNEIRSRYQKLIGFMDVPQAAAYVKRRINIEEMDRIYRDRRNYRNKFIMTWLESGNRSTNLAWFKQTLSRLRGIELLWIRGPVWCVSPGYFKSVVTFDDSQASTRVKYSYNIRLNSPYQVIAGPTIRGKHFEFLVNTRGIIAPAKVIIDIKIDHVRTRWGKNDKTKEDKKYYSDLARRNSRTVTITEHAIRNGLRDVFKTCYVPCKQQVASPKRSRPITKKKRPKGSTASSYRDKLAGKASSREKSLDDIMIQSLIASLSEKDLDDIIIQELQRELSAQPTYKKHEANKKQRSLGGTRRSASSDNLRRPHHKKASYTKRASYSLKGVLEKYCSLFEQAIVAYKRADDALVDKLLQKMIALADANFINSHPLIYEETLTKNLKPSYYVPPEQDVFQGNKRGHTINALLAFMAYENAKKYVRTRKKIYLDRADYILGFMFKNPYKNQGTYAGLPARPTRSAWGRVIDRIVSKYNTRATSSRSNASSPSHVISIGGVKAKKTRVR